MTVKLELKPPGQRPRCKHCNRELRPNFTSPTLDMPTALYGEANSEARKQWEAEHPKQFMGTYGGYSDNLFCGLRCGYRWAVKQLTKP